jgi:hypothetical protein
MTTGSSFPHCLRTTRSLPVNEVLSEVVDLGLTVRQAQRTVREGHELRAELDRLFTSARACAALLVDTDSALGVSALARMPSVRRVRELRPTADPAATW